MATLQEAVNQALSSSQEKIRLTIRKESDKKEPFDPDALLYSLFEAEIPFEFIFELFSRIIERLVPFNSLNEITERQLHGLVATTLSAFPNPSAAIWVSNYHNVATVGAEISILDNDDESETIPAIPGIVSARQPTLIRDIIKEYLARELRVEVSEVKKLVDVEDLRDATNRIVKFLRFAGLSEIRSDALGQFIEEVTYRSQKKLIHRSYQDEEELKSDISMAERSFETARLLSNTDRAQAHSELKLAHELLGRVFLSGCSLPSRPARQYSFQYLHTLLRRLEQQGVARAGEMLARDIVAERFNEALSTIAKDRKYQIKTLREAADVLEGAQRNGNVAISESTAAAFTMFLYAGRSLHGLSVGKTQIARALKSPSNDRSAETRGAAAKFAANELHLLYDELESSSGPVLRVRELARLKTYSDCLKQGRDVLMLFRFFEEDAKELESTDVQDFLYRVLADSNSFGIIFSNQNPGRPLLDELKRLFVAPGKMVLWMDTNALSQTFSRPDAFLATIDTLAKRALPELNARFDQARQQDYEMIPADVTGYVRDSIAGLNRLEADRSWSAAKGELVPFLEELTFDYKYYFYERIISATPKSETLRVKERLEHFLIGGHLGSALQLAREGPRLPIPASLKELLSAFVEFIDKIRHHRNRLAHDHCSSSDVAQALRDVISAIEELTRLAPYPHLYLAVADSSKHAVLLPLFGAPDAGVKPVATDTGQILAAWKSNARISILLPKMLRPKPEDQKCLPMMIQLTSGKLAIDAHGSNRLSAVLLRAIRHALAGFADASRDNAEQMTTKPKALVLIRDWLSSITTNPRANATPDELSATLSRYDGDLATVAVECALSSAADLLGIEVSIHSEDHALIVANGTNEKIACSIIDQDRLQSPQLFVEELKRWEMKRASGLVDHFAFLLADPIANEDRIRTFKKEMLEATPDLDFSTANRILEPKHTYFLLERTQVERPSDVASSHTRVLTGYESTMKFDVFVSYNTDDQDEVDQIVRQLRRVKIHPWFDRDDLQPGTSPMRVIEKQIKQIRSAAVFFGREIGPLQREEMEVIFDQCARLNRPVIPVILRQVAPNFELPLFLANRVAIDFRCSSPPPIDQLIWAITGRRTES